MALAAKAIGLIGAGLLVCATAPAQASDITPAAVNEAIFTGGPLPEGQSALSAHVQILLDRHHASPGEIDGRFDDNVRKAIRALEAKHGLPVDGEMDQQLWRRLTEKGGPAVVAYRITSKDLVDIVGTLPEDYSQLAKRKWLGYASAEKKLAERFHMADAFLRLLNPGGDISKPGTEIWVADPGSDADIPVKRIVADKAQRQLRTYDRTGVLVATAGASGTRWTSLS